MINKNNLLILNLNFILLLLLFFKYFLSNILKTKYSHIIDKCWKKLMNVENGIASRNKNFVAWAMMCAPYIAC